MGEVDEGAGAEVSLVERVARAICRVDMMAIALEDNITLQPGGLDASIDKEWRRAVPNARAAIAAMRDPTAKMVLAGGYSCQAHCDLTMDAARKVWPSMIDAALSQESAERERSS